MKIQKSCLLAIFLLLLHSCSNDDVITMRNDSDEVLLNNVDLPKYPEPIVDISTHNYVPDMALGILEKPNFSTCSNNSNTRAIDVISEVVWANGFGRTIHAQSDESIVQDNMNRYVYPGSVLEGPSVADMNYKPINIQTRPINVSVSFPAKKVRGTIDKPSLSKTRQFVMDMMQQEGIGEQSASVKFDIQKFTSYDEMKMVFGSNTNTSFLFWSSSSSHQETEKKISKNTGLYIKFVQKYFTIDMDIPHDGFVVGDVNQQYTPVYVSSIAYGRIGILAVETDQTYEEAEKMVKSAFNGILYSERKTLTTEEKAFFANAEMKVFVGGGNGESGVKTFSGVESFMSWITEGGKFSSQSPGAPIFCSFAYLSDHSPYKVKFKIDIDSDPVFARIEYKNQTNDNRYNGQYLQIEDLIGDVHLCFYADRNCNIRTIAPRYISFNLSEHKRVYKRTLRPKEEKDETFVTSFTKNNMSRGIELQLYHNHSLTYFTWGQGHRKSNYNQTSYRWMIGEGAFYKVVEPINIPASWVK